MPDVNRAVDSGAVEMCSEASCAAELTGASGAKLGVYLEQVSRGAAITIIANVVRPADAAVVERVSVSVPGTGAGSVAYAAGAVAKALAGVLDGRSAR